MRQKKGILLVLLLAIMVVGVSGCGKAKKTSAKNEASPDFIIDKDNCFTVVYEEGFEADYYDGKELETLIDSEITEFNEAYAIDKANGIVKEEFGVKGQTATLKLKFSSYLDYINYTANYVNSTRNARLFVGKYEDAVNMGYSFAGSFVKQDGAEAFNIEDVKEDTEVFVLFTNEGFNVQIDGEILGMSSCVKVEDNLIVTSDRRENYIIYKQN